MPPYAYTPARIAAQDAARARSGWTAERLELAEKLWMDGESATQIGVRMGVSRNAVIGIVHRKGWKRAGASDPPAHVVRKTARVPRVAKPNLRIMGNGSVVDVPDSPRKPWVDPVALQERANAPAGEVRAFVGQTGPKPCLWPLGDPGEPGYHSCGEPALIGKSYCPSHQTRAVQPRKEADPAKSLARTLRRYA